MGKANPWYVNISVQGRSPPVNLDIYIGNGRILPTRREQTVLFYDIGNERAKNPLISNTDFQNSMSRSISPHTLTENMKF